MIDPPELELALFSAARQMPERERRKFLDESCGGDDALRQRIEELLQAGEAAGDFLNRPAVVPSPAPVHAPAIPSEKIGDKIGHYKLLQQIGEGGCGVVYMAEQEEPVRRRVALKVIKLGMDTKSVIARFEAERQALAMMDHPNIAKVYEAGATETGRPYFVMELVRGVKITDFCDRQNLGARERLDLFIQVCKAVQHAHQKGIIHRDIKPSNILVTTSDLAPVPKVIDFGIAKATTDQRLTDKTLFTAFEQFIGTPAYMSPEQAEMNELGVDTRSDIYSLGILLYELLTGTTPFSAKELMRAGLDEIRRIIREQEPARPSTRLSTMAAPDLTEVAKHRRTEPAKLTGLVRGELDWIVMKSLEKDRARRYETASGLAMDVQRYLADEPVMARPTSKFYRFQKLVCRHKMAFIAAGAVLAALLIGLGISTYLFLCEKREKERATAAQITAQLEAEKSRQVAQFLDEMLEGVGPEVAQGRDTALMRAILDKTEARIALELKAQPEVEARLYSTLAGVYDQLDDYAKAEAMCRTAIQLQQSVAGKNDQSVAQLIHHLGSVQCQRGDLTGAEKSLRQVLAMEEKPTGQESPDVIETMANLAEILQQRGDLPGAESLLLDALKRTAKSAGPQLVETAFLRNDLGLLLWLRGDLSAAEASLAESLSLRKSVFGEMNPEVAVALGNIGLVRWERGNLPGAEQAQRQALAIRKKLFGEEHTQVANSLNNLALVLRDEGDLATAEAVQRQSLAIETKIAGLDHPNTVSAHDNLAAILRRRGALSADARLFRESLELNPTDPLTAEGFAALLADRFLTPLAVPGLWRYTSKAPPSDWASPDFSDKDWQSTPALSGLTNYVPHSERAVTPRTNLWLRTNFELSHVPAGRLVGRLNRNQDAQLFLNGVPVASGTDWSDTDVLLSCSAAAQAALRPGRNVLAIHCEVADGGALVGASLCMEPVPSPGWAALIEEFNQSITNQPQRAELYVGRANALVRSGRMAEAAKDLAQATVLKPMSGAAWYGFAPLLVTMNQQSRYQSARREIFQRFAKSPNQLVAERVARIAMLTQIEANELNPTAEWADRVASLDYSGANLAGRQLTESLALYRCGRYVDAVDWSGRVLASTTNESQPGWSHEQAGNLKAAAWFLQAMAQQKLQKPEKARAALAKGVEVVQTELPAFDGGDLGRDWADRLIVHVLEEETKATMQ